MHRIPHSTTTQAERHMEGMLIPNVIVSKSAVIIQLFAIKDEALLFRPSAVLHIDHHLDIMDGVCAVHL
jgi:hypothetical protein